MRCCLVLFTAFCYRPGRARHWLAGPGNHTGTCRQLLDNPPLPCKLSLILGNPKIHTTVSRVD